MKAKLYKAATIAEVRSSGKRLNSWETEWFMVFGNVSMTLKQLLDTYTAIYVKHKPDADYLKIAQAAAHDMQYLRDAELITEITA